MAVKGFNDPAQVEPVFTHPKNARAPHAIQWLQDDVLVLGMKLPDGCGVACHQRGRSKLGKLQKGKLFGVVAQSAWVVEHLSAFVLSPLQ